MSQLNGHRAVRLLLLAPPGAGKGTQGVRLAAWSGVRHIAAGDLLRAEARAGGRLGREIAACQARGDLVPDQIVLDLLTPAVTEAAGRVRPAASSRSSRTRCTAEDRSRTPSLA